MHNMGSLPRRRNTRVAVAVVGVVAAVGLSLLGCHSNAEDTTRMPADMHESSESPSMPSASKTQSAFISVVVMATQSIQQAGILGVVGYTAFFAAGVALCLPCTPLEMLPGFLFGFWVGLPVAIVGKNLGNLIQVLVARTILRQKAEKFVQQYEKSRIIEHILSNGGILPVMIFRAIALPLYVKNVFLALTGCSVRIIMLSCVCTGFPFALVWTYLGSKGKGVVEIMNGQTPSLGAPDWMTYAIPIVLLPIAIFVAKYARESWMKAVDEIRSQNAKKNDSLSTHKEARRASS